MKSDVPEYVSEALPDLIQSVPAGHDDTTENKVSFLVDFIRVEKCKLLNLKMCSCPIMY